MHTVRRSPQQILDGLEEQLRGLGHLWLWKSANQALNATAHKLHGDRYTLGEKAVALRVLGADPYPPRPTSLPLASVSYTQLREVLSRGESEVESDEDLIEWEMDYFWNQEYMADLFTALIGVIGEHGIKGVGWKSALGGVRCDAFLPEHSRARFGPFN
ncbi:hypothetical protein FB451DRAFT_1394810 [Mycena latifolia]|nr:hypothetical protein FB451DRAFT_1394810 [Mycena latifolia]